MTGRLKAADRDRQLLHLVPFALVHHERTKGDRCRRPVVINRSPQCRVAVRRRHPQFAEIAPGLGSDREEILGRVAGTDRRPVVAGPRFPLPNSARVGKRGIG